MSETPYYQKNIYVMLNGAKDYYKNDKVRLREEAWGKYRNLSKEEEKWKREYGKTKYHNMSEEKKTKSKRITKELPLGYKVSM